MGHDRRHDPEIRTSSPRRVGDRFPMPCKHTSWRLMRAAGLDRSPNAGLLSCTTIPSPSSPTLLHASSARGTQAPPTTGSGLRLGLNVAVQSSTRADLDTNELLRRGAKRLSMNSPARPRGGFHDKATQLHFNASRRTMTREETSQQADTVAHILSPPLPSPCIYKRERRATVTRVG
jgi:hypothetical protein